MWPKEESYSKFLWSILCFYFSYKFHSFLLQVDDLAKCYPNFVNYFEKTKEIVISCDRTKPRFHAFLMVSFIFVYMISSDCVGNLVFEMFCLKRASGFSLLNQGYNILLVFLSLNFMFRRHCVKTFDSVVPRKARMWSPVIDRVTDSSCSEVTKCFASFKR